MSQALVIGLHQMDLLKNSAMNPSPNLNKLQYAIVSLLFEYAKLRDPVTPLEFTLSGDFLGKFNAVVGVVEDVDEAVFLVATLPRYTNTVFVALTRGQEMEVARLLANLEDYERENMMHMQLGEVAGQPHASEVAEFIPHATILMPIATADILQSIPPVTTITGQEVRFMLVLPLSKKELECRNTLGHDAMIDMFQKEGKSLFFH